MWRLAKMLGITIDDLEYRLPPARITLHLTHLILDDEEEYTRAHGIAPDVAAHNQRQFDQMASAFEARMDAIKGPA